MSHLFWLDQEHLSRIEHMFPKPRGVARSDDRTVLSGIIHVIRKGQRWWDAPAEYARRLKTLGGLAPYEYICKIWTSEPDRFILDPIHQMPGLNT